MLYGWELITEKEKKLISEGIRCGEALGGPWHMVLFPTDRCNIDCFFCYTETLRNLAKELDWELLRPALLEGVDMGVKSVSFGGGGEPLIYRSLGPLFDLIEEKKLKVDSIKTNGTALTESVARRLIGSGLSRITISLNDTRPEEYEKICRASPRLFEKAMGGIHNIVEAKRKAGSDCEISVQVFVWRENYKRLPRMIEDLLPTDADFIYVNSIDGLDPKLKMTGSQKEEFRKILVPVIEEHARRIQFNLAAEGLHRFAIEEQYKHYPRAIELPGICKTPHRVEFCYMGWYTAVIEAGGDLFPCCHFTTDPSKSLGNLHSSSLKEIWQGEPMRRFRGEMRHLLLTDADPGLLPRHPRFIFPLCMERTACAFNYYLCDPAFYMDLYNWAKKNGGSYRAIRKLKSLPIRAARKIKRFLSSRNRI